MLAVLFLREDVLFEEELLVFLLLIVREFLPELVFRLVPVVDFLIFLVVVLRVIVPDLVVRRF